MPSLNSPPWMISGCRFWPSSLRHFFLADGGGILDPEALYPVLAVNLVQGGPEPHGTTACGQPRRSFQPPMLQIERNPSRWAVLLG